MSRSTQVQMQGPGSAGVSRSEPGRMYVKSRGALHGIVQEFVVGVGDDVLKRRRLGLCLPRCLPL